MLNQPGSKDNRCSILFAAKFPKDFLPCNIMLKLPIDTWAFLAKLLADPAFSTSLWRFKTLTSVILF